VLVKDDLVHSFGKVNIHLVEEGGSVSRRLATEGFGVLSLLQDTVSLVGVYLRNLVLRHVINIVVVLDKGVSVLSLLMSSSEAS